MKHFFPQKIGIGSRQHRIMSLKRRETHEVSATIALAFCPEMLLELWLREAEPRRRPWSIRLRGKKQSLNCQDGWNFQGRVTGEQ